MRSSINRTSHHGGTEAQRTAFNYLPFSVSPCLRGEQFRSQHLLNPLLDLLRRRQRRKAFEYRAGAVHEKLGEVPFDGFAEPAGFGAFQKLVNGMRVLA